MTIENKTILLVEDDAIIAMDEKRQLERKGYSVILVGSGEKAVSTALKQEVAIDLILMDIDLGRGMDGTEAAEQILNKVDIPIVFLSSHNEPEVVEKTEKITSYGYVVKNSGIVVLDASLKMAFKLFDSNRKLHRELIERQQAEKAVRRSEERYRTIYNNSPVMLHSIGQNGQLISVSDCWLDRLGYKRSEVIGRKTTDFLTDESRKYAEEVVLPEYFATGICTDIPYQIVKKNGEVMDILLSAIAEKDQKGNIKRSLAVLTDITKRKQAEKALKKHQKNLKLALKTAKLAHWELDLVKNKLYWSDEIYEIFGLDPIDDTASYETFLRTLHPDDADWVGEAYLDSVKNKTQYDIVHRTVLRDGTIKNTHETCYTEYDQDNTPLYSYGVARDITETKQAEDQIKNLLKEKETLLREVHHRIKNNIASIGSLLSLQANSTENDDAKAVIQEAINRVHSMQVLYEKLLMTKDYHELSVKDYLSDLAVAVERLFIGKAAIELNIEIEEYTLDTKTLFPLGLILSELLTNSMKHGFRELESGIINIIFSQQGNEITLAVKDNGCGLPDDFDLNSSPGFGLTLVNLLVEQICGSFSIDDDNGARSIVKFEL